MWIFEDWVIEVRAHLLDHGIDVPGNLHIFYDLFDQGLTPVEALLYFLEN